ncbi:Sugar phosphatase YidA [Poriferisphaera corsica]|uniref:Sugar phosphatase YidA n=1 Tax=Poriferisphaera corsica TaxID=2528020 RepID=A0A517YY40_9BACT|nr:HAD family hydrolase [Poriferisphaera corsica]QDU35119.1 Sugar phosphatase YidA [Poriferisphaera corsica]
MRYDLIAVDMDGTLLGRDGEVSKANQDAVRRAVDAGVRVVPCTGRGWREAKFALEGLVDVIEVGIFVTGAMVNQINSGESVEIAEIEPHLAKELIDFLGAEPEAVLCFRDANVVGHDYLVTGSCELVGNTSWWFEKSSIRSATMPRVGVEDLHAVLRVGMVACGPRLIEMEEKIRDAFADRVLVQHFMGVQMPDPVDTVYILEVFAAGIDKWRGVRWLADQYGIKTSRIACIGDEINDVSMLSNAGLGVAMGNAVEKAAIVANRRTLSNEQDGVAYAIHKMLDGEW